jgi:AcrR family transcriptional regulator
MTLSVDFKRCEHLNAARPASASAEKIVINSAIAESGAAQRIFRAQRSHRSAIVPTHGLTVASSAAASQGFCLTGSQQKQPPKARKKKPKRRGRPHRSEGGVKAQGRLLDAAEQLFAERGFYGVTTRQVASMAGADDALIYYHFKNKWGLFNAVFERRARVLITARHDSMLAYIATGGLKLTAHGAIAAFINPMIELSQNGDLGWKSYFALVAQIDNTPWGGEIIHRFFDSSVHELIEILQRALPGIPKRELYWAYNFLAGSMMLALSETERVDRLSEGLCRAKDLDEVRTRLVNYCAGGFLAMVTEERLAGRA